MELFEILDKHGKPTGEVVDKTKLHKINLWHRAAHVWITNSKGELLLQKRAVIVANHADMWDISVAGHTRAGDTTLQTAKREAHEELGLRVALQDFKLLFTVRQQVSRPNEHYFNNEINDVYLVKLDLDISKLKLQKEEVSEVKFISVKEFIKLIQDPKAKIVSHEKEYKKLIEALDIQK